MLQATTSEGLAQGPYEVARVGFEPVTLWMEDIELYHLATSAHHAPLFMQANGACIAFLKGTQHIITFTHFLLDLNT